MKPTNGGPEVWRRTIREHVLDEADPEKRCKACGKWWPCWERAYAYEQLILNGEITGR